MKTLDEQLTEMGHEVRRVAQEVPDKRWADQRPRRGGPVATLAGIAVVAIGVGVPALLLAGGGDDPTQIGAPTNTATPLTAGESQDPAASTIGDVVSTTVELDQPRNIGPNVVAVSSLPTSDPQVPDWPNDWERVDEILSASGISYDDYPDVPRDAAVRNGVAVIAAGNAEREVGIWYSTDGTWQRAIVSLTPGMTIGESPGDHRIADGIQNVEAFSEGFVAWEQVQLVGAGDQLDFVGTLVLVSTNGIEWTGAVYGEPDPDARFTDFGEYGDGYVATLVFREDDGNRTELVWTSDLMSHPIDWEDSLAQIASGYAHDLVVEGSAVFILLEDFESDDNEGTSVAKVEFG